MVDRRFGDIEKTYADTTKVSKVLGWTPKKDLNDPIRMELVKVIYHRYNIPISLTKTPF